MSLWIDGWPAQALPLPDRGLEYGDGLYETLAVRDGRVRLVERHLARLAHGAERLGIALPPVERLRSELEDAAATPGTGVLKLILTRGAGGTGYAAAGTTPVTRVLQAAPPRARPPGAAERGVQVRWCALRLAEQPALAGIKSLNRLEQVLARREWSDAAIAEGLLCDVHGRVVCGTMTNVFAVRGGALVTPSLARCGVAGVMRGAVRDALAAGGLRVAERDVAPAELESADEVFLTNALIGAWPVRRLGEREYAPGPVVRRVQSLVAEW